MTAVTTIVTEPPRAGTRRRRMRGGLFAAVLAVALLASACTVSANHFNLLVVHAEEDGFLQNGDEPYIGVISWRVIPGAAGSASTAVLSSLSAPLATGVDDNQNVAIPPTLGQLQFDDVQTPNLAQLLGGTAPELVGSLVFVMEHDFAPWSVVNGVLADASASLRAALQAHVETAVINYADPSSIGTALQTAVVAALLELAAGLPTLIVGLLDDPVGIAFSMRVAVWDAAVGALIESQITAASITPIPVLDINVVTRAGIWYADLDTQTDSFRLNNGDGHQYRLDLRSSIDAGT